MRTPEFLLALSLSCAVQAGPAVDPWPLPAPDGAAQPHLHAAPDGRLWLSWMERQPPGHRLQIASFDPASGWRGVRTAASGERWFVNWADVPAVAVTADGAVWTHTLEKSADATYAYDVVLRRSGDGGANWSAPRIVHDDGTPTEHGFVTLYPWSDDALGIVWLDGRNTGGGDHDAHAGHQGGGAMTLRGAVFDATMTKRSEWELDTSTCDCCQTTVARTARGPVVVYRDRAEGEIRDILATRFDGERWTAPVRVHADDWFMPACPVNGPSAAAEGDDLWVAWYTAAGGPPSVRIAHSRDAGDRFGPMREVAGADTLGRVALAASAGQVWLAWMEEKRGAQSLWLARYAADLSTESLRLKVADIAGRGRGTGFPRLVVRDRVAHLVWTEVVDGQPRLRGARIAAD